MQACEMRRGQASCGAACAGPLPEVAAGGVSEDVPFPLGEEGSGGPRRAALSP